LLKHLTEGTTEEGMGRQGRCKQLNMAFKTGRAGNWHRKHYIAPSGELALEGGGNCHKTNYVMMRQKSINQIQPINCPK